MQADDDRASFHFSAASAFKQPSVVERYGSETSMTSLPPFDSTSMSSFKSELEFDEGSAAAHQALLTEHLTLSNDGFFRMLQEANPEVTVPSMSELEGLNIEMSSLMAADNSNGLVNMSSQSLLHAINLASSVPPQDRHAESFLQSVVATQHAIDTNGYPSIAQTFKGFSGESENGDGINDTRSGSAFSDLSRSSEEDGPDRKKSTRKVRFANTRHSGFDMFVTGSTSENFNSCQQAQTSPGGV
jgi:hypothetical protein